MVLFKCSVEASWLKAFLRAYSSVESYESYWLWTSQHIEGKTMDPSHVRAIVFKISPLEYYAAKDKVWVRARPEDFLGALKRYKVRETVPLEVRDDGTFWVGELQVGNVVEEKDLPSGVIFPTPLVKADGFLKVAVRDFKRIVTSLSGVKLEDATVGFRLKGRDESTMILFRDEETFSRVDIKPYEKWLLDIGGSVLSCYNLHMFNASLVLGLSDVASITIGDQAPCEISHKGDFFDVAFYMAHSDYRMETFRVLLEKKPVARRLAFVLEKAEIDLFRDSVRSVTAAIRGEEVWIGVNVAYGLFLYWKFYDQGYFNLPKRVFREFWDVGTLAGSFRLSSLASWLRGVEEIECFLEGEPATAMVLVGKGESIAPKEARSDEIGPLDVPVITPVEVFRGPREVLAEVFADAVAANDVFLVFITSPYEIKVIGQDAVYYRASLPLDGFKTVVEEEYVPVSGNLFRLGEFLKVFPGYMVSIGRPEVGFDVYVGGETATGEFRAMFAQTAEEAAKAVDAYKAEMKPPAPAPPEARPLVPPPIEYVKVLILKSVPQFVGADMKVYGPYEPGEIREMSKGNAELLVKQGLATYEIAQPPPPVEKRVPVTVAVSKSKPGEYMVDWLLKEWKLEAVPERPIMVAPTLPMDEVERTLARHEEFYDASEIQRFAGEDWYEELPQEFKESATLVWTDEQVTWSEDAAKDREIFHYEYKREDLEPMTVEDLRNIAAIKNLSTKGKKEDLINAILGIVPAPPPAVAPPAVPPPAPPPKVPLVKVPPLVLMKGLQKADEKRLLVRFDALLLERTITPAKWRPMFEDRLYDWREAFKDLPRDEAMEKAFSEVEKLVGDIVGLAKPPVKRPPEVAPPAAPPAAPEVYVPPAELLGPRTPRIRVRKCWVLDCPEMFEADEDLENRVRMVPVMKADTPHLGPRYEPLLRFPPIFYYLCPTHRDERFGYRDVIDALAYLYFETESSSVKRLTVTKETFRDLGLSIEDMTIIQARAARWRPE